MGIAVSILALLVIADIVVSILLLRSPFYSRTQQFAQLALIWLLPVIGLVAVLYVLRQTNPTHSSAPEFVDDLGVSPVDFGREHNADLGSHGDGVGH
jgi:beta-lactamase regulating signal transducer with metallopeptidase domain